MNALVPLTAGSIFCNGVGLGRCRLSLLLLLGEPPQPSRGPFTFACLWETWKSPHGEPLESCTILTTEANELMRPIHDRMPVILDPASEGVWLDQRSSADALRALFVPFASERMEASPVGPWVSNARNQGPRCLEPTGA